MSTKLFIVSFTMFVALIRITSVAKVIKREVSKIFVYVIKLDKNKSLSAPRGVSLAIE